MVADKFTGAPRGFCFAEFATIADAAKVLHTFNVRRSLAIDPATCEADPACMLRSTRQRGSITKADQPHHGRRQSAAHLNCSPCCEEQQHRMHTM
jgi:RNA recognition motif-containing protein